MSSTDFGSRVAAARKAARMTQQQVADALGLKRASVGAWEDGRNSPSLATIEKLAELLGLTPSSLSFGEGFAPASVRPRGGAFDAAIYVIGSVCWTDAEAAMLKSAVDMQVESR